MRIRNTIATAAAWRWQDKAACRNNARDGAVWADLFAEPDGDRRESKAARQMRERAAKKVCSSCPVRAACLTASLADGDRHTIRGGLTPDERAALRDKAA